MIQVRDNNAKQTVDRIATLFSLGSPQNDKVMAPSAGDPLTIRPGFRSPTASAEPATAERMRSRQISVIVPVRDEEQFVARTLDALVAQDFDPWQYEILVVDGHSSDNTPRIVAEYAAKFPHLRMYDNPRRWSSAARNIGVRHARGEFILIVDGHCELTDRMYLQKLVAAFERSGADCVGRPQPLDVTHATPLQRAIAAARQSRLGHHPDSYIYSTREGDVPAHSVAVAYRRGVFERVGLFDDRFDACEDVELNHRIDRAGLRCFFTPDVAIRYEPRGTLAGLFRQLVRYGRGRIRLMRKHADTRSLKTLLPGLFVAGLVLGGIGSFFSRPLALAFALVLTIYALLVLTASAAAAVRTRSWAAALWLPLVFVTIHLSAGSGLLLEWLQGRRDLQADLPSIEC